MCKYSLEGYETTDAKEGDTVYTVSDHSGAFSSKPGQSMYGLCRAQDSGAPIAVCVPYNSKVTIENVQISDYMPPYYRASREYAFSRQYAFLIDMVGKRAVFSMRSHGADAGSLTLDNGANGDHFVTDDGRDFPSNWLRSDVPIYIGVKPSLEQKLGLTNENMLDMGCEEPVSEAGETQRHNCDLVDGDD